MISIYLTLIFGLLLSSNFIISAYEIVIEKPTTLSKFFANENVLIRWNRFEAEPNFTHVDVQLAYGSHKSYVVVSTIAQNFDISHTHFVRFKAQTRTFREGNYFIIFKAVEADYETFSQIFKIIPDESD